MKKIIVSTTIQGPTEAMEREWLTLSDVPFLEPKNLEEEGYQETYSFPERSTENFGETVYDEDHSIHPDASPIVTTGSPVGSTLSWSELPKPQGSLSVK